MSEQDVASLVLVGALLLLVVIAARVAVVMRRQRTTGSRPGEIVVQCRDGHVFRTIWIPLVSIKAIRLGWLRFQYCPVGEHWTLVMPIRPENLTSEQRRMAALFDDGPVP